VTSDITIVFRALASSFCWAVSTWISIPSPCALRPACTAQVWGTSWS